MNRTYLISLSPTGTTITRANYPPFSHSSAQCGTSGTPPLHSSRPASTSSLSHPTQHPTAPSIPSTLSSVKADLGSYISSLHMLLTFQSDYMVLYPGHGPVVAEGAKFIGTYIAHWGRSCQRYMLRTHRTYGSSQREAWTKVKTFGGEDKDVKWQLLPKLRMKAAWVRLCNLSKRPGDDSISMVHPLYYTTWHMQH